MGEVVPFRNFKFRRDRMVSDVELLLCPEEERYIEFKIGEGFAKEGGRKYIRTTIGCRFWGIADVER